MIKKTVLILIITLTYQVKAQFFRGAGLFVCGTMSSHHYKNSRAVDSAFFMHTYPAPSHRSAEYFSWSAGIFAEFLKYKRIRWQTELEYCNKGAVERPLLFPWPAIRGDRTVNKYAYIQWNNYAKIFFNEGYRGTPYIMLGARLEYNLSKSVSAYHLVAANLPKITVSPDAAIGYEFVSYSPFKLFTEFHYNPDLLKVRKDAVTWRNRTYELRVGIIYRPQKAFDDCNAPRYHGTNY